MERFVENLEGFPQHRWRRQNRANRLKSRGYAASGRSGLVESGNPQVFSERTHGPRTARSRISAF
jgi:hypothetical protein